MEDTNKGLLFLVQFSLITDAYKCSSLVQFEDTCGSIAHCTEMVSCVQEWAAGDFHIPR